MSEYPTRHLASISRRRWIVLGLLIAIIEVVYLFIVSAGKFVDWPTYLSYYDQLAEGLRSGHLHLSTAPPPELVAAPDPLDRALQGLWAPDASYFKGQFYIYWGPVPALLMAGIKTLFRIPSRVFIGDQYLVFAFYTLQLIFGALLLERMSRRLWDCVPLWALTLGLVTFAFATPTPHSLANPGVYSAAIVSGQAFLLGGVLLAFVAVTSVGEGPVSRARLLAVGSFWALAIGCRATLSPSVLLLGVVTALATRVRGASGWRSLGRDLFWLGLAPALGICALLLYNKLRFESWTEFGFRWQMTAIPFVVTPRYLPANLYSYLLRPLTVDCHFPFLEAPWDIGARGFPAGMAMQPGYSASEPVVGIPLGLPVAWLGVAALLGAVIVLRGRRAAIGAEPFDPRTRSFLWCAAAFAVMCTNSAFPLLFLCMPSMRYLGDINAGLVLLGILGAWWMLVRYRNSAWRRRLVAGLVIVLSGATIVVGLLVGYPGYAGHFRNNNPALDQRLTRSLSVCRP